MRIGVRGGRKETRGETYDSIPFRHGFLPNLRALGYLHVHEWRLSTEHKYSVVGVLGSGFDTPVATGAMTTRNGQDTDTGNSRSVVVKWGHGSGGVCLGVRQWAKKLKSSSRRSPPEISSLTY